MNTKASKQRLGVCMKLMNQTVGLVDLNPSNRFVSLPSHIRVDHA